MSASLVTLLVSLSFNFSFLICKMGNITLGLATKLLRGLNEIIHVKELCKPQKATEIELCHSIYKLWS